MSFDSALRWATRTSVRLRKLRLGLRDTLDTWPSLRIALELSPWHWGWRFYRDWDLTSTTDVKIGPLRIEWFANRPLFPLEMS